MQTGDIEHFTNRKLTMAKTGRKKIYVVFSACAYISFLLVFVGLVSSAWTENTNTQGVNKFYHYGLFANCIHGYNGKYSNHVCTSIGFVDAPAWLNAARVLILSSTILLFTLTPVSCYLHFVDDYRDDVFLLTLFAVISAVAGLLGAVVFGALRDSTNDPLSWGFAIFVSGEALAVAAFVIICTVFYCCPQKKPTVRPYYIQ